MKGFAIISLLVLGSLASDCVREDLYTDCVRSGASNCSAIRVMDGAK